jgi:cytochrome c556
MTKKYKRIWNSKAEYDEHNRRVEEDVKRLRALAEKAQAELDRKRATAETS